MQQRFQIIFLMSMLFLPAASLPAADLEQSFAFSSVAAPELLLGAGTRALGMGGAGTALGGELSTLFWNPAGLAAMHSFQAEFSQGFWIQDMTQEFVAVSVPLAEGCAALSFNYLGLGQIENTGIDGSGNLVATGAQLGLSALNFSAGYGVKLPGDLSLGGAVRLISESLGGSSPLMIAVDLGAQYPLPVSGLLAGLALKNFGTPVNAYSLPAEARLGVAYTAPWIPTQPLLLSSDLEMTLPAGGWMTLRLGGDYRLTEAIYIRAGWSVSQQASAEAGDGVSFGAGLIFRGWRLGYAFTPHGALGSGNYLSASVDFDELVRMSQEAPAPVPARAAPPRRQTQMDIVPPADSFMRPALHAKPAGLSEGEQAMRSLIRESLTVQTEMHPAAGSNGNEIAFHVQRSSGPRIAEWVLSLTDAAGQEITTLKSKGTVEVIRWDLRDKNGQPVTNVEKCNYRLLLTDVNHGTQNINGPVLLKASKPDEAQEQTQRRPREAMAPVSEKFTGIYFDQGRAEISRGAAERIAVAAACMRRYPYAKVYVEGYTDPVDEDLEELILSKSRAEAVTRYLTAYHKISIRRIIVRFQGGKHPAYHGDEKARRGENRRVEITVKSE